MVLTRHVVNLIETFFGAPILSRTHGQDIFMAFTLGFCLTKQKTEANFNHFAVAFACYLDPTMKTNAITSVTSCTFVWINYFETSKMNP